MTLTAFSTYAYVRNGTPTRLVYVNQPAAPVTITGSPGSYWLAVHHDTSTAPAGWNRVAGTHYLWRASASQPPDPTGGLVMASVTVVGGNITLVGITNYPGGCVAFGAVTGGLTFSPNLTWDGSTLRVAGNVNAHHHIVSNYNGDGVVAYQTDLLGAGGTNRWAVYTSGDAPSYLGGGLTVAGALQASLTLVVNGPAGFGGGAQPGYSIYTYFPTRLAVDVGIGIGLAATTATLDVNGTVRVRSTLTVDGNSTLLGSVGIGRAPDGALSLVTQGNIASGGTLYCTGAFTAQTTIYANGQIAGGSLATGGTLAVTGAAALGSTLAVSGNLTAPSCNISPGTMSAASGYVNGNLVCDARTTTAYLKTTLEAGFQSEPLPGYSITTGGAILCGGVVSSVTGYFSSNLTCDARITTAYLRTTLEAGFQREPIASVSIAANGAIFTYVKGYQPGGGMWLDTASMAQYKADRRPLADALALLLRLQGYRYTNTHESHAGLGEEMGFVAEEVQAVLPQWVSELPTGGLTVGEQGSTALVVEALRTIVERLEALEGKR